ncbi:MAG TPA: hypothetical protein VJS92_04330 [Candidatus Polarisedimenticolaceae bacterium]|nr:hypothetical protein [Candidatus Polarisedimenticolaceae bacterium]
MRALPLASFFLATAAALAQLTTPSGDPSETRHSAMSGQVSFSVPARWELMNKVDTPGLALFLFFIPYPAADGTRHSANAVVIAKPVPAGMTIRDVDAAEEGLVIASDTPEGDSWRTVLGRAQDEVPYLVMKRMGIREGTYFQLSVAYPLMASSGSDSSLVADEFNAAVKAIRLSSPSPPAK